jgi:hypothetical protein
MEKSVSGCGPVAGFCEHGNGPSDSIKGREFFE